MSTKGAFPSLFNLLSECAYVIDGFDEPEREVLSDMLGTFSDRAYALYGSVGGDQFDRAKAIADQNVVDDQTRAVSRRLIADARARGELPPLKVGK